MSVFTQIDSREREYKEAVKVVDANRPRHTPGPWSRHQYSNTEPFIVRPENGGNEWIAYDIAIGSGDKLIGSVEMQTGVCGGYQRVDNVDETEANARLIAAAPDLLDALKKLTDASGQWIDKSEQLSKAYLDAHIAIAKATGAA